MNPGRILTLPAGAICAAWLAGCSPTVKVEAPDKPIEINLNIKIEQRIVIEREVDKAAAANPDIF